MELRISSVVTAYHPDPDSRVLVFHTVPAARTAFPTGFGARNLLTPLLGGAQRGARRRAVAFLAPAPDHETHRPTARTNAVVDP